MLLTIPEITKTVILTKKILMYLCLLTLFILA